MKLICNYGYYKFYSAFVGEIKLFENKNGVKLYNAGDFWTFESLAKFPNFSFAGQQLAGILPAIANYAGKPEKVMSKNKLTYNLKLATITPTAVVAIQRLDYSDGAYMTFGSIPQAYALDKDLQQITGFESFIDVRLNTYKVERFFYENL